MPDAKSIIVMGVPNKLIAFPPMPKGAGVISAYGIADDYHTIIKALLKKLATEMQQHTDFKYKIYVDSPNLDERALAVKAGLGFLGRNGLVISKYGSRFNIGLLLTDIPIERLSPHLGREMKTIQSDSGCPPSCRKCIDACPGDALSIMDGINSARCISYLTQKDGLTPEEAAQIGYHLYGCDICQDVCPLNQPQPTAWAVPEDWISMTDEAFANTYGHTAMLWRGAALLRRNAKIVMANRENTYTDSK